MRVDADARRGPARAAQAGGPRGGPRARRPPDDSGVAGLTGREREISDLITERMTNKQIAAQLFLSEKTIESHIRNVFNKLGASSRVEVARAIERERRENDDVRQ